MWLSAIACPRNHLDLLNKPGQVRLTGFCFSALAKRQDSGQLAAQLDLQLARHWGQDDGLDQGTDRLQGLGIATCLGLIEETRVLSRILRLAGFEVITALCKVGSVDKTEIGLPEELKVKCSGFEAACNPILQARLLNREGTGLNVVMGLCVGHDSLFFRHSQAPATTLVVKDRVLGHNPVAALYTTKSYSARLLDEEHLRSL